MEIIFTVLLLILVLLFYFSNRNNKVNKWCAVAGFLMWIGVFKEAFLSNIIPLLQTVDRNRIPYAVYIGIYSVLAWIANSFAMPTAVLSSLYFCNIERTNPKLFSRLRVALYIFPILFTFVFLPFKFYDYQLTSSLFWIVYSSFNLGLGAIFVTLLNKGVRIEKPGKVRTQKMIVSLIIALPVIYCLLTVYIIHPLNLNEWFNLWQGNVVIISVCIVVYILFAFRDGIMGLKLSKETYLWNSDLSIINKGAEYTSHMLKNQTVKMEWCIENLKAQFDQPDHKTPEELEILSRSICTLKSYMDKIKKHSETICLLEELCNLRALFECSLPSSGSAVSIYMSIKNNVFVLCDKTHLSEVFDNILSNAIEAMHGSGTIEIIGKYDKDKRFFLLSFTDHGIGMSKEDVKKMFMPYFTTKNTEKNFGLGLAYCKNVVEKHDGRINAESEPGNGTTVTIEFPAKRITINGTSKGTEDKNA